MGKVYERLTDAQIAFIKRQKVFFVATAPLNAQGHVNLSPKGYDAIRIIDANTIAYGDLGGSGIETVAHIRENRRITLMFCAFEGPAMILRLYGKGRVLQFDEPGFAAQAAQFPSLQRLRNIITVDIERIADSCGWGVPFMEFREERDQLKRAINHLAPEDLAAKRYRGNAESIDGLPGLKAPEPQ